MRILNLIALGLALALPGAASAVPFNPLVDFRQDRFDPGSRVDSHLVRMDGYDILFETLAYDTSGGLYHDGSLYWDDTDGFGIRGSGYENDEIEHDEVLRISFSKMAYLDRVLVTDLYDEDAGIEQGRYSVDGGASWTTFSADGKHSNGAMEVGIFAKTDSILFTAPGRSGGSQSEYSVAGADAHWDGHGGPQGAVPEPGAALLFSAGFLLLRGRAQRR